MPVHGAGHRLLDHPPPQLDHRYRIDRRAVHGDAGRERRHVYGIGPFYNVTIFVVLIGIAILRFERKDILS